MNPGQNMIATLQGEITQVDENAIIVETMGFGLRVNVPAPLGMRLKPGETILLFTHLVVREDAWNLFGFETKADRDLFLLLLGADGVGPRTALAVISGTTIDVIQRAVFGDSPDLLGRVPGVGKKTAQKIVLYLHDRLKPSDVLQSISSMSEADNEVLAALTALGYSVIEAQTAIQSIPKEAPGDVGERLRLALQYFSG
jgi:Holliday junction DNA helicase RuvA